MHEKNWIQRGPVPAPGAKVLVLLHGRGGSADDILTLAGNLDVKGFSLFAPQAEGGSWYPYSFLAPPAQNEPWLSSALSLLNGLVDEIQGAGVSADHIYFSGFSQGACLTLEFVARNATRYGGVAAFTGGLIGDRIYYENYTGDFKGTPVFIGTGDPDPHVPVTRVAGTTATLRKMGAAVTEKVYPHMGHTITLDEIKSANEVVFHPAS